MAKSRGGQPRNQNAAKHGFYSRAYKPDEALDLEAVQKADLTAEISMLRVVMRRVFEQVNNAQGIEEWSAALGALGAAASRLGGMLQVQQRLNGGDEIMAALSQALKEVAVGEKKGMR